MTPLDPIHIAMEQVTVAHGRRVVLDRFSCSFRRGALTVVLGGSGVGKSTLLNVLAGLMRARSGVVRVDGCDVTRLPESGWDQVRQKIGMLFQGAALLDSLSVFENLALPLRERTRQSAAQIAENVHRHLASVGLTNVDELLPGQLSGGMRKRVALARALMKEPEILLCDEPFSGLDPISMQRIEALLAQFQRERRLTLIAVAHEPEFALRRAHDALVILPDGAVSGPPAQLRLSPDPRVRSFLGEPVDASLLAPGVEVEAGNEPEAAA
jgi:phospholipid/cholesterol/gamma-HCH transport system ATP-binding protein